MKLKIRKLRTERKLTLDQLAEMAGISRPHLNQIELGNKPINSLRMQQIADALEVSPSDLFAPDPKPIPVLGYVGAGEVITIDGQDTLLYDLPCPAQLRPDGLAAVEVRGNSMLPAIAPGSVLFYRRHQAEGVPAEALGRVCIAETEDGNVWAKQVKQGDIPKLYNMISINPQADNLLNRALKWATPVLLVLPPELAKRS